jgi:hypothetical protein
MKTLQKGFIAPLLLILIAVLLVGGGTYAYVHTKQENRPAVVSQANQAMSIKPRPVAASILLDNTYNRNLTDYERALTDRMSSMVGSDAQTTLKFYDNKTVLFSFSAAEDRYLDIYNIDTLEKIDKGDLVLFGNNYIESSSYIIVASIGPLTPNATSWDEYFAFYKKGATDFQIIPNSILPYSTSTPPGSETYEKAPGGMGTSIYDFTFDELTKTFTASVFKRTNVNASNIKIRTVKFVLP